MKNKVLICLLCVIFIVFALPVGKAYAFDDDYLEFYHKDKIFTYSLSHNIKTSSQFDINYQLNKYKRFSSKAERQQLMKYMLSLEFDKEIILEYMFPNLTKTIEKIEKTINKNPKNASLKINSATEQVFFVSPEVVGLKLDKNSLFNHICQAYITKQPLKFNIPTTTLYPEITTSDYKYTSLRADFSTDISKSTPDRKHNVKNALASLNKVEIYPNQIFSFNNTVGRRTEANGYRQAKIIVNNEFVDGIGGGVCQVSSTLYNTALLAGLEIVEANKHSKQVSYVKYGFDAMVNYGSSDLKFRNNTNEKLTIITNFSSSKARIRIFGQALNNVKYKLVNEIISVTEPTEEIIYDEKGEHSDKVVFEDESFYLKPAYKGMEIKSYREIYENNTLKSKQLLRFDKFKVQNAVKVFGTKKRTENSVPFLFNLFG